MRRGGAVGSCGSASSRKLALSSAHKDVHAFNRRTAVRPRHAQAVARGEAGPAQGAQRAAGYDEVARKPGAARLDPEGNRGAGEGACRPSGEAAQELTPG